MGRDSVTEFSYCVQVRSERTMVVCFWSDYTEYVHVTTMLCEDPLMTQSYFSQ